MPWWSWRPGSTGGVEPEAGGEVAVQAVRVGVPAQREPAHACAAGPAADPPSMQDAEVAPVTLARLGKAEAGMPGIFAYVASHPPSVERQKRFATAAGRVAKPVLSLRPEQWADVRAMCGGPKPKREFPFRL